MVAMHTTWTDMHTVSIGSTRDPGGINLHAKTPASLPPFDRLTNEREL